jgi:hypothetical protein
MDQEHATRLRQFHRARSGEAVEQAGTGDPLQVGDLLAHGRLGVSELLGGRAERPVSGYGLHRNQVP